MTMTAAAIADGTTYMRSGWRPATKTPIAYPSASMVQNES